ncbi:SufD family Fe-S cluster assembly protein [Candidatus Collierbacteria bacterium]|nr:SufD family Fe-S cluster assembly protein [Candidatus Collierbacteria bacterium]
MPDLLRAVVYVHAREERRYGVLACLLIFLIEKSGPVSKMKGIMKQIINKPGSYRFVLDQEGQELEVVGRFKLKGKEVGRWDIEIIHAAPNTSSRTNIKGVVDGSARTSVFGTIKVLPEAKGTEAFLEERILLVSENAKAEAVPNLEIETDEVKCSHAATVGKIDEEEIFYLQNRGIKLKQAKDMIAEGFLVK